MSLTNSRGRTAAAAAAAAVSTAAAVAVESLERRTLMSFTLQLLHASDLEAGVPALNDAPAFSAILDKFQNDPAYAANTLTLSAGDNWIPSPFYTAGADPSLAPLIGAPDKGRADIEIMNAMGFEAAVFGNHEFDEGTSRVRSILSAQGGHPGARFPYLSANLNFSGNSDLNPIVTADGQQASTIPGRIAKSTVITVNGETFGVVGITTPLLAAISQPGTVTTTPATTTDPLTPALLAQLAAAAQPAIDALVAGGVDKVIVLSHLQNLNNEVALAPYLRHVDILVGGGSNAILADSTDYLRPGSGAFGNYPLVNNVDQNGGAKPPTVIVNTDGNYRYVGRLVVEFDDAGVVNPASVDPAVSGAYATDDAGLANVGLTRADANPRVQQIVDALEAVVSAKDGRTFGKTSVYLNGERAGVRTQETNFGNLTADANLFAARQVDSSVQLSLKNGGGIRDAIGEIDPATGAKIPPQANAFKGAGEVSQLDIENSLRFNNGLSIVTVTAQQLKTIVEHGVAAGPGQQGRFPQVGGFHFAFDFTRPAGSRIVSLAVKDAAGNTVDVVVKDGAVVGDAGRSFKMVTLDFLAAGGDGYPIAANSTARVDLVTAPPAEKTFDTTGGEQKALADYLAANHASVPFSQADAAAGRDARIQNLAGRSDTVNTPVPTHSIGLTKTGGYDHGGFAEGAAEITAYDPWLKRLFVINAGSSTVDVLDLRNPSNPIKLRSVDLSAYGSPNSIAVRKNVIAVAVAAPNPQDPGQVVFLRYLGDNAPINRVTVGALPDMLTFTPDGDYLLVANEGEPAGYEPGDVDPEGSVSIIRVPDAFGIVALPRFVTQKNVSTASFRSFNGKEAQLRDHGVRIFGPGATAAQDFEPEYIAVSPDSKTAYVTLQENNAIAVIDVKQARVTSLNSLGTKDHALPGNGIDASDRDGKINIANYPNLFGLYMPDAVQTFSAGGQTFLITANEGDARDYDGFAEEARVKDLALDPVAFPNAAALKADPVLGRLNVTKTLGDTDGDGDYDKLYAFGSRSFTIWRPDGTLVFDSGDQFERITAEMFPQFFNASNEDNTFDSRSDNKGPEPEGVVTGVVNGRTYAFIGLERIGGVMVYDVTNPASPAFVQYVNTRDFAAGVQTPAAGDLGPEGLTFIPASQSPSGKPLLIVANEISGTTAVFTIDLPGAAAASASPTRWTGPGSFSSVGIVNNARDDDDDSSDDDDEDDTLSIASR